MRRLVVTIAFLSIACRRPPTSSASDAAVVQDASSPVALPVTLHDATHDVHIEPNWMLTCAHDGGTVSTKTCAFELASSGNAIEKLCALAMAAPPPFDVVYSRVEQGGAAGKHEIYEVRSDGVFTVKDVMSVVLRRGTAPIIEVAPLARLIARPELAALGPAYVDPTPPPSVLETDYDLAISKTTTLKGAFHDKTPPIITAITSEIMRVTMLP
jgi:hypothetical protein